MSGFRRTLRFAGAIGSLVGSLSAGGCFSSCSIGTNIPAQPIPLAQLAQIGAGQAQARKLLLLPDTATVPTIDSTAFQLGLNDPCFSGDSTGNGTGIGLSLEAFAEDLTDVQCRPALGSASSECFPLSTSLGNGGVGQLASIEVSSAVTPVAFACKQRNGTGFNDSCLYAAAPAGNCTACIPTGDAMGNPKGTFFAFESDGENFLRFPDAVTASTLPSGLVDLLGFGLFNISEINPGIAPTASQSQHSCGGTGGLVGGLASKGIGFNTISGWIRGLQLRTRHG